MRIGQAFYCDECGCEVWHGDVCNVCKPGSNASEQVIYHFTAIAPEGVFGDDRPAGDETTEDGGYVEINQARPWWKFR